MLSITPVRNHNSSAEWSKDFSHKLALKFRNWIERSRERSVLEELDDSLLNDIGLTREAVEDDKILESWTKLKAK